MTKAQLICCDEETDSDKHDWQEAGFIGDYFCARCSRIKSYTGWTGTLLQPDIERDIILTVKA